MITDCHIHIAPMEMFRPQALELVRSKRPNFEQIAEYCRSPKAFLKYMDSAGIDRGVLINDVAPEVTAALGNARRGPARDRARRGGTSGIEVDFDVLAATNCSAWRAAFQCCWVRTTASRAALREPASRFQPLTPPPSPSGGGVMPFRAWWVRRLGRHARSDISTR